ncbi:probable Protease B inhibitors 2 and 1 [Saccharomycodes ludwigii]|uniref:Probable Protease B inhibitors 2 and 1 n=1 Tax=Saccharomycodes ludwigii TaxID=36035 RepID=A0A376B882_9ASCO|nr:hypothetical protein SCDLUD_002728 [Saccharomycodes ludwigii]KAH3901240.1 hypothetical protein SCDLUD_002728 [Saccharomycodes ludwigii]SSD60350.1 probable Protease B inhibitors 2 and 1 [Saccharomycodes ludwigii]
MTEKSFIVTLKEHADAEKFKESVNKLGGSITHEFNLIKGFTVKLPDHMHINKLKEGHSNDIANVEEDKEVHTN